jgi:hypothetical protein
MVSPVITGYTYCNLQVQKKALMMGYCKTGGKREKERKPRKER